VDSTYRTNTTQCREAPAESFVFVFCLSAVRSELNSASLTVRIDVTLDVDPALTWWRGVEGSLVGILLCWATMA
jgi:hypothetical protein